LPGDEFAGAGVNFRRFSAAAQRDHFSLCEKLGLGQCSQKAPKSAENLKRALHACKPIPGQAKGPNIAEEKP
jgi:hypothetical protein